MVDVFVDGCTPISSVRRDFGRDRAAVYVGAWLLAINDIFNMENKLNKGQIGTLTEIILKEYYYLNDADMKLIYNRIMRGENFARLDVNVIIRAIDNHCTSRHELAESVQIERSEVRRREEPAFIALNSSDLKQIGKL